MAAGLIIGLLADSDFGLNCETLSSEAMNPFTLLASISASLSGPEDNVLRSGVSCTPQALP